MSASEHRILQAPSGPPHPPEGVPASLSRFIGRSAEVEGLRNLLSESRALTLTGPGGSGKTRLALEAIRSGAATAGGGEVWWVELAPLQEPSLVAQHVASSLGLIEEAGRPPEQALIRALRSRSGLLVLDNCEHLCAACAALAESVLRACPEIKILVTSREALGIDGETAWLVPPLSLPRASAATVDGVGDSEAVQLFVDRARAVHPRFRLSDDNATAVAGICRRLDGVPLAIELAAARVKVLTPNQILERLDDCFAILARRAPTGVPRHQTIRAAIDWSYDLLGPGERLLFERLSVFPGGFSLEAAEAVGTGDVIEEWEVLDLVASLVERSLVTMREHGDSARYHLQEVVRQYGQDRLGPQERVDLEHKHAAFYASLADDLAPHVDLLQDPARLDRLSVEHDNLRAALNRSLQDSGRPEFALRIAAAYGPVAVYSLQWREGRRWLESALARAGAPQRTALFARALRAAGSLAGAMDDHEQGLSWLRDAETIARELNESRELALILSDLAAASMHAEDGDLALAQARESVAQAKASGDPYVLVHCLATGLGFVHAFRGETDLADERCAEAQTIAGDLGYALGLMFTSFSRAMVGWMSGDFEAADRHSQAAVEAIRHLDNRWYVGRALFVPGAVALHRGDAAEAVRLLAACETQYTLVGGHLIEMERPLFDDLLDRARAELGEQAFAAAWAEGADWSTDEALTRVGRGGHQDPAGQSTATLKRSISTAEPPVAAVEPAAELVVRALGPLEIVLSGELLDSERWAYAKPRELLVYLLCNPRGATKEEMGRALWPDASPPQVRNNLHVTLHYLRKTLGSSDWIVFGGDRYRLSVERTVWFDFDEFIRTVETGLRESLEVRRESLERALRTYRGELVEEERFGSWCLPHRDRARDIHLRGLSALADAAFAEGDFEAAQGLYERVVARDDLREDAHRGLMLCLARSGDGAGALRQFQRLELLLREELDTEPDPETQELARALRSGKGI